MSANTIKVKILAVDKGTAKTKTNKDYTFLEVTFRDLTFDKTDTKKIMPFGSKEVFSALEKANSGDIFTVVREKDNGGYWQWISLASGDVAVEGAYKAKATGAVPAPKSNYETAEERAKRQVYIVRQSSISSAIEYLNGTGAIKKATADDVIFCAKQFEKYVFNLEVDNADTNLPELAEDEDIPM